MCDVSEVLVRGSRCDVGVMAVLWLMCDVSGMLVAGPPFRVGGWAKIRGPPPTPQTKCGHLRTSAYDLYHTALTGSVPGR